MAPKTRESPRNTGRLDRYEHGYSQSIHAGTRTTLYCWSGGCIMSGLIWKYIFNSWNSCCWQSLTVTSCCWSVMSIWGVSALVSITHVSLTNLSLLSNPLLAFCHKPTWVIADILSRISGQTNLCRFSLVTQHTRIHNIPGYTTYPRLSWNTVSKTPRQYSCLV